MEIRRASSGVKRFQCYCPKPFRVPLANGDGGHYSHGDEIAEVGRISRLGKDRRICASPKRVITSASHHGDGLGIKRMSEAAACVRSL